MGRVRLFVKADTPSTKWPWSYEVLDTKLKRKEDVSQHLQLVVYSNMIVDIQGVYPNKDIFILAIIQWRLLKCLKSAKMQKKLVELRFIESGEQAPQRNVLHVRCVHIVAIAKQNGRQSFLFGRRYQT